VPLQYLLVNATNGWITALKKRRKVVIGIESLFTQGTSYILNPLKEQTPPCGVDQT
jgi:hypothetical protein